jgi:hypothetical protein
MVTPGTDIADRIRDLFDPADVRPRIEVGMTIVGFAQTPWKLETRDFFDLGFGNVIPCPRIEKSPKDQRPH